jgi:hypothetical protein
VRLRSLIVYTVAGFATGYLVPSADNSGKALRAAFVQKQGVPPAAALLSLSLELFFSTIFEFPLRLLLLFGLGAFTFFNRIEHSYLLLTPFLFVFFVVLLIPLLPKGFTLRLFPWLAKIPWAPQFLSSLEESRARLMILRKSPIVASGILALSIAINLVMVLEVWIILRFLGANPSLLLAFLAQSAFMASGISFTPGGIGILETLEQEIFAAFGQGPGLTGAFIVALRGKDAIWVVIGLAYLFILNGISIFSFLKPSDKQ